MKFLALFFIFPLLVFARETFFNKKTIQVGDLKLKVEIADTESRRAIGLMGRAQLKDIDGMLFSFDREQELSFWMKNTYIPLSIGFFDKDKKLIDIQDMRPVTSEMEINVPTYRSKSQSKYALEVPQGWFKKNKIKLGDRLVLP